MERLEGQREKWWAALLYVTLILIAYLPIIFLGRTLQPSLYYPYGVTDQGPWSYHGRLPVNIFDVDLATPAYYEWPINRLVGDLYRRGTIPLWDPYQAAGTPLAVQYSSRVFFPYQILENLSPTWSWDYFLLGRLWCAGFFTFLFLRRFGLSFLPAFLGGIFYMFSGSLVWFINLEQMANVAMVLPLLLFSLERLAIHGSGRPVVLAGAVTALVLLGGQPETTLFVLALGGLFYGFRIFAQYGRALRMPVLRFLVACLVGLGLAAPLLLPFWDHLTYAYHLHPAGGKMGVQSPAPWPFLIGIFTPTFFHRPVAYVDFADNGHWDFLGGYTGVLPWLLITLGLVQGSHRWRKYLLFFSGVGGWILLKNFGIPPFDWIGYLPLFDQAWSPRWAGPVWTFSLAVAAAFATEILQEGWRRPREGINSAGVQHASGRTLPETLRAKERFWGWLFIGSLCSLIVLAHSVYFQVPIRIPNQFYYSPLDDIQKLFFGSAVLMGYGITILTLLIAQVIVSNRQSGSELSTLIFLALNEVWFVIPRGYPPAWQYLKLVPWILGLVTMWGWATQRWKWGVISALGVVSAYGVIDLTAPQGFPDRHEPFTPAPYIEFLQKQPGWFRVMGGGGVLFPNFAGALGIYDVRYIQALSVATYQEFTIQQLQRDIPAIYHSLWFTGLPKRQVIESLIDRIEETKKDIHSRLRFYSLLGVKYFVFPRSAALNRPAGIESGKVPTFPLVYDHEVTIYENPSVLPRAFVVFEFEQADTYQEAQQLASRQDFDFSKRAVLEEPIPTLSENPIQEQEEASAAIVRYEAQRVELRVQTARPGMLILTDTYYPGWQAEVNGQPVKIYRVNGLLRGIWLPAGEHQVVFSYWPDTFQLGLVLAGISSLLCYYCWRTGKP